MTWTAVRAGFGKSLDRMRCFGGSKFWREQEVILAINCDDLKEKYIVLIIESGKKKYL